MSFRELTKQISRDLSFRILSQVSVEHDREFTPDAYQLFPSRYIAPYYKNRVICVDYDMGTGKTLTAALALSKLLSNTAKIEKELRRSGDTALLASLPRPYIIGNWSTVEAFEDEFLRPMFGMLTEQEYADLVASKGSEDPDQYERLRSVYVKRVHQRVRMASYQKMFNRYFRGSTLLAMKDERALHDAIQSGEVTVDPTIATELSNAVLVIDELQMLYSGHGWNTYGYLLDHIRQNPGIKNLTTIALSGTFINSSPVEMIHVYNLIRDKFAPRVAADTYFQRETIGAQTYVYNPKKSKQDDLVRLFDGKVASYRISHSRDFPDVRIEGELVKIGQWKFQWLKLHRCIAPDYQWEQYLTSYEPMHSDSPPASKAKPKPHSSHRKRRAVGENEDEDEDEDEQPDFPPIFSDALDEENDDDLAAHDFAVPPREEWPSFQVEPVSGASDVYTGRWLRLEHLRARFGAIPAAFIQYLKAIIAEGSGEKVVAHHRRIERGGLMQYVEALKENGFTLLGDNARNDAICILCGKELKSHASVADFLDNMRPRAATRLASESEIYGAGAAKPADDHKFMPATFALLTGRLAPIERMRIIIAYNSPANRLNHRIMCLLVSGVGERGITLKATNHGIALDVFPGIPAWRQFRSRIARHGTHKDLPPDKQWVKMVTMVLSPPAKSQTQYSRDEFRYLLREMNDEVATSLWERVRLRSVNCPLILPDNRGAYEAVNLTTRRENTRAPQCAWSLERGVDRAYFNTFYYVLHVTYVKRIIRRCLRYLSPIWTLASLRAKIVSDTIRKVPHNMGYSSDVAIGEAIVSMCAERECQLQSIGRERDLTTLPLSALKRDDIIVTLGVKRRGPRILTMFTAPIPNHSVMWTPLSRAASQQSPEDLRRIIGHIGMKSGFREKTALFDRIVGKPGIIAALRDDFESEGPLFKLLKRARNIVWSGDDESHLAYAANHIQLLDNALASSRSAPSTGKSPLTAVGFIIGKEYHSLKSGAWSRHALPMIDASHTKQWDICAIFSPGSAVSHGRWHTRTRIRPLPTSVEDLRKVQSGMACLSLTPALLRSYATKLGISAAGGKTEGCSLLERGLLEKQLSPDGKNVRFIYTPFETPPTAKVSA